MGCPLKVFFPPKAWNLSFQVSERITEMNLIPEERVKKFPIFDIAPSGQVRSTVRWLLRGCGGDSGKKDGPAAGEPPQRIPGAPPTERSGFCCHCHSEFRRESKPPGGDAAAAPLRSASAVFSNDQAGDQLLQQPGSWDGVEFKDRIPVCRWRRGWSPGARGHIPRGGFRGGAGCSATGKGSAGPGTDFIAAKIPPGR